MLLSNLGIFKKKYKKSCYFTVFVQYLLKPLKLEEIVGK